MSSVKGTLLKDIVLNFYKGNLNFILKLEDLEIMDWDFQDSFLAATFNSKLIKQYPVSCQYSKLFLKKLIEHLEPEHEVHDDIYAHLCTVMNDSKNDGFCYRHYVIGKSLDNVVTVKETRNMVVNGTTGLKTWEAALMLSDWALCNKDVFSNKYVLELGSGVGFAGITIGKMCPVKSLMLSDCHEEVLTTIKENIVINFANFSRQQSYNVSMYSDQTKSIGAMRLDWNDIENLRINITPDIIIGADIVYDPMILEPLCNVFDKFCNINSDTEIYIASVIRNEETFKGFLKMLDTMNYKWDKIALKKSIFVDWNENIQKCLLKIKLRS
ncbi:unnamed protein product [Arctia plantaginis]|uniref:FAM86 N-terminal domain-containing protein n=1 Tax=Arctia plantaginis TaxID=874455 RepID=A0A8S1AC96_ARCPL|nr:unnamed protein product [Arctia plantaginis]